ncbi:MAG: metalloregulator ArsR/SmtB family transcription factor [Candidatus Aegiribacteria sp.]|nr:metalloregulator ArsR/SmtB family transcription factor [Candidatus Aegiribacteria sp.]
MASYNKPDQTLFDMNAEILRAMAHPVRLMIMDELLRNPKCVTAIHEILDVSQPNISQHLTILRNSGIVASDRDGSYRCYYLRRPGLVKAVMETLSKKWPEADIENVRGNFKRALSIRLDKQGVVTPKGDS